MLRSLLALLALSLLAPSAAATDASRSTEVLSKVYAVDRKYRSMEGPMSTQTIHLAKTPLDLGQPPQVEQCHSTIDLRPTNQTNGCPHDVAASNPRNLRRPSSRLSQRPDRSRTRPVAIRRRNAPTPIDLSVRQRPRSTIRTGRARSCVRPIASCGPAGPSFSPCRT